MYLLLLRLFLSVLIMSRCCSSWAASCTVEWSYTPPSSPAVTGFRLYKNNAQLIDFPGSTITSGVFTDTLVVNDVFELTALFADSTESPRSPPFTFTGGASFIRFGSLKFGNTHGSADKPGQVRLR